MKSVKKAKSNTKQPQLQIHPIMIFKFLIQFTPLIQTSSKTSTRFVIAIVLINIQTVSQKPS